MKNHDDEVVISYFLRGGVILSISFILLGVIIIFLRNGGDGFTLSQLANYGYAYSHHIDSKSIPLGDIFHGIGLIDGIYFITLGLWILIFTPITVVIIGWISFFQDKNYLYVAMASIVLFDLFFAMLVIPRYVI
ncbi:DUF1634 domain-containing protein [Picrophilus oshimae]|uniref:DUF1634 domain-containing protein n=1 Tax=Picrophilus torridus (strain ATCC 700027 / DSM 9790 / JCM 10055 / NBRC 100828 / KAW 2/3) TaxID=1122961 RepID=Q6KZM0_PICTO|nr:DUF1634 domain-containing protein [Picrophilus oshimae]AAT43832.1 hypothetical protein PTO1247 [Picrophilus oshimae DSM 9789]